MEGSAAEKAAESASYTYWFREASRDAAPLPAPKKINPADLGTQPNQTHLGSAWNRIVFFDIGNHTISRFAQRKPIIFLLMIVLLYRSSALELQEGERCLENIDCAEGLHCESCPITDVHRRCTRVAPVNPLLKVHGLPFNRYTWLTTHRSFAKVKMYNRKRIRTKPGRRCILSTTGVRGLELEMYDLMDDIWLCRGNCYNNASFLPAIAILIQVEAFLRANPTEIVTIIIEDYVTSRNGLSNVFNTAGLNKFWFPVSRMPKDGGEWPTVSDMVSENQRLIVFTSNPSKELTEGIAYVWKYIVENQCMCSLITTL